MQQQSHHDMLANARCSHARNKPTQVASWAKGSLSSLDLISAGGGRHVEAGLGQVQLAAVGQGLVRLLS